MLRNLSMIHLYRCLSVRDIIFASKTLDSTRTCDTKQINTTCDILRYLQFPELGYQGKAIMSIQLFFPLQELSRTATLKTQIEVYKKETHSLHERLTEETERADRAEFEKRRFEEKLTALTAEKDRVLIERDTLRESIEELKVSLLGTSSTYINILELKQII